MRQSYYWDDFENRAKETCISLRSNSLPKIRRVAIFITDKCNFKCKYCNSINGKTTMSENTFNAILNKYGNDAIIHITGGEPSCVPWLYPFLKKNGQKYKFHLNTNAFIMPPAESVRRLKISLDSYDHVYWDCLVGRKNAFKTVLTNIKKASEKTITTITYTLTKENFKTAVEFSEFIQKEIPNLYAIFFSIYKGTNPEYIINDQNADIFFNNVIPRLLITLIPESKALLKETIDEKNRLINGVRFPENNLNEPCYLSMSERVFSPDGYEYNCSHLYRDHIFNKTSIKNKKCLYGCNRRLIQFNEYVSNNI